MNPRKPTALKKIEGTYRKDRAAQNEIKPTLEISVTPPDDLNEWGKRYWMQIMEEYAPIGLVTKIDLGALKTCCMWFGIMMEADDIIQAKGLEVEEPIYSQKGELVGTKTIPNPMLKVASDASKNYRQYMIEFGLTPASRVKLSAPLIKEDDDPFREL